MNPQDIRTGKRLHGFAVERIEEIAEIHAQAIVGTHEKTGARVVQLFADDPNNLFCIGFRTPVYNNTGVPHILEHSVLSGSVKFPLKDPFKELLKGSLQTFLNAMTYPDKTIYPVSSQVEADFFNLIDVYCDAVFHPLLSETTFQQEGWHFDAKQPDGPVGIRGIVYNEMKGVFSEFRNHVSRRTFSGLFPDTTYFYESGGDPEQIPSLTYDQFTEFHRTFYHPSNAFIFLYGDIPLSKTLAFLQEQYLAGFERRPVDSRIAPQQRWDAPRRIEIRAPASKEDDGTASVLVCWLFGDATDPETMLLGSILSRYLLGTESSPLRRALIDSGLGEDLDDMSGFDADFAHGLFCAGLRKTRPEHADAIERLVLDTLRKDIERGLDEQLLEGAIRQTEFGRREISDSGHAPYNLMLAERCFRSWLYDGDPLAHLSFERPLSRLKQAKAQSTAFFGETMRAHLLDNPHRLCSVVVASQSLGEALGSLTEKQSAELTASFDTAKRAACYESTQRLLAYQKEPPAPEAVASLPRLNKGELPRRNREVPVERMTVAGADLYAHPIFTSGIAYLDMGFDILCVPDDLLRYFQLYAEIMTRCGAGEYSYEEMARRVSLNTGGIHCSDLCSVRGDNHDTVVCSAVFHGKALHGRFDEMTGIFNDLLCEPHLNDTKLIRDTLLEMRNGFNAAVVGNGHVFAATNASSRLCRSRYLAEILGGISQLRFLNSLVKQNDMTSVASRLQALHDMVVDRGSCFVSLTAESPSRFIPRIEQTILRLPLQVRPDAESRPLTEQGRPGRGIEISSSVNFVAKAWKLDGVAPDEVGTLMLMAKYLSTGFLWEKVRVEGGAYGGKAFATSAHPAFACASYRDPNLLATLDNFEKGLAHMADGLPGDEIDQSIIGTVGIIDSPKTPHRKGLSETVALVCGRSREYRQAVRDAVLSATSESLARKARELIEIPETAITVLGSRDALDTADKEEKMLFREALLS
ncbi:MAG: hypothetical protein GF418_00860 [Chitinivibrionales bacterium]|nr:hypothetical protein [Chitinivibrionales bacterium]MBD3394151.1 hypothetical protein [Chitinivibrionales bacterium]